MDFQVRGNDAIRTLSLWKGLPQSPLGEAGSLCSDCLRAGRLRQSPEAASPRAKAEELGSFSCQGVPRTPGVVVEAYGWAPELLGQGKGRIQTPPDVLDRDAVCSGQRVALVLFRWVFLTPETSIGKTDSALAIQLPEFQPFSVNTDFLMIFFYLDSQASFKCTNDYY